MDSKFVRGTIETMKPLSSQVLALLTFSTGLLGIFMFAASARADTALLTQNLRIGDKNPQVLILQRLLNADSSTAIAAVGPGSPGSETDYFGALTRAAVMRFQYKYRTEILYPASIYSPTGFVGVLTRAKFNTLQAVRSVPVATSAPVTQKPKVLSVSPARVRRGDSVVVSGENFTPTGNTITLGDGPVSEQFADLPSPDGKTITFVYKPPDIKNMTEPQVRSLPPNSVSQIENPVKAAGWDLADALVPYKDVHSEAELKAGLERNGHSFDEMYHYFWVIVENAQGRGSSHTALLHGLRSFPFETVAKAENNNKKSEETRDTSLFSNIRNGITNAARSLFPVASAQGTGGGITSGIVMVCTCSESIMTFQLDFAGGGSGLYVFEPGFIPSAGSGIVAGFWLGGYETMGGECSIYYGYGCIDIQANIPQNPVGYSF